MNTSELILDDGTLTAIKPDGGQSLQLAGHSLGAFPSTGATKNFDYASSASLINNGTTMTLQGWVVPGGGTQVYKYRVWADDAADGGQREIPLQLVVYGPIEVGYAANTCYAPVTGGTTSADQGLFSPKVWGWYFVSAYHAIDVSQSGILSLSAAGDANYSNAHLSLEPSAK